MEQLKSYASVVAAVLIGILLQILLVWADSHETPGKIAEKFTTAYYRLDPSMAAYLCRKTSAAAEGNAVEQYIRRISQEAADRGVTLNYMKHILYNVETHTHRIDDVTAEVKITANRRVSINPVYALVARFFLIGETHKLDELLTVVKEDGRWKVCGAPFSLVQL